MVLMLGLMPFWSEAHSQVPRHHPVPLNTGDERVNPIQQQLRRDGGLPQVVLLNQGHPSGQAEVITSGDRHPRAAAATSLIMAKSPGRMELQPPRTAVVFHFSPAAPALGRRRACRVG